jgi:hypothetical protein
MTVASRFSIRVAAIINCLLLTSVRTDDVAADAAIWLILLGLRDEPLWHSTVIATLIVVPDATVGFFQAVQY